MTLHDNFGRPLLNLRISVTQKCNYHCTYCHMEGETTHTNNTEMNTKEITQIAKATVELGITRIKLTGGEPLIRKDICEIVKNLSTIPGLKDLSLTTNGSLLLPNTAKKLYQSGLNRINISLPTLNPKTYNKLTKNNLNKTLTGINAAIKAGFNPIKLNMVILKNINENDVLDMITYAEKTQVILQLIELDPINLNTQYYKQHHHNLEKQEEILKQKAINIKQRQFMHNRQIYQLPNTTVETVHPIENTDFCNHCTRLRLTSDGKLKTCLMQNNNLTDILTPLQQGAGKEELKQIIKQANQQRKPYNNQTTNNSL